MSRVSNHARRLTGHDSSVTRPCSVSFRSLLFLLRRMPRGDRLIRIQEPWRWFIPSFEVSVLDCCRRRIIAMCAVQPQQRSQSPPVGVGVSAIGANEQHRRGSLCPSRRRHPIRGVYQSPAGCSATRAGSISRCRPMRRPSGAPAPARSAEIRDPVKSLGSADGLALVAKRWEQTNLFCMR